MLQEDGSVIIDDTEVEQGFFEADGEIIESAEE